MEFAELFEKIQSIIVSGQGTGADVNFFSYFLLAAALLTCFLGQRLHKIWMAVIFFLIGFFIGILSFFILPADTNVLIILGIGLALGTVLALLSRRLTRIQFFFINAFFVFSLLTTLLAGLMPQDAGIIISLIAAIIIGILAAKLKAVITIVTTAVSGAINAAVLALELLHYDNRIVLWIVMAALSAAGIAVQFFVEKKELAHIKESFTRSAKKSKQKDRTHASANKEPLHTEQQSTDDKFNK